MSLAKEEIARKLANETNKNKKIDDTTSKSDNNESMLKKGDYCRATYTDGIDYEAKIEDIIDDGKICLLKYVGYGNEEFVNMEDITVSWGKKARKEQILAAQREKGNINCELESSESEVDFIKSQQKSKNKTNKHNYNYFNAGHQMAFPPPPPMPPMLEESEDAENLSAMLMSWYMSGYYTGLYQGQKLSKQRHH